MKKFLKNYVANFSLIMFVAAPSFIVIACLDYLQSEWMFWVLMGIVLLLTATEQ